MTKEMTREEVLAVGEKLALLFDEFTLDFKKLRALEEQKKEFNQCKDLTEIFTCENGVFYHYQLGKEKQMLLFGSEALLSDPKDVDYFKNVAVLLYEHEKGIRNINQRISDRRSNFENLLKQLPFFTEKTDEAEGMDYLWCSSFAEWKGLLMWMFDLTRMKNGLNLTITPEVNSESVFNIHLDGAFLFNTDQIVKFF